MGRILGLDFGTRRVGAAVSDPRRSIATPLEVYHRQGPQPDAAHFRHLIQEHEVDAIVVGLPLHTWGREGDAAAAARAWGAWLAAETGLPVHFHDERYTTIEADEALRAAGLKASKRIPRRDMLAAQILLQDYLDAGCPTADPAPGPLDDPPEPSP